MAINVNTVYKTVLSILNKEQRGYMTPQEFNTIATQVQLEIFEQYFEDLNQHLRVQNSDSDYADRIAIIEEKMSIFKTTGSCTYVTNSAGNYFLLPTNDLYGNQYSCHKLGSLAYTNKFGSTIGPLEELQKGEFYYIQNSRLTASTEANPTFIREGSRVIIAPSTITTGVIANYIRKPLDPIWGFTVGTRGQYIYNPTEYNPNVTPTVGSRNFELHESEQTNVILKVLVYAGLIIKDPQVVQIAMQQSQIEEANSKS
jgi:hypothetical protein